MIKLHAAFPFITAMKTQPIDPHYWFSSQMNLSHYNKTGPPMEVPFMGSYVPDGWIEALTTSRRADPW